MPRLPGSVDGASSLASDKFLFGEEAFGLTFERV